MLWENRRLRDVVEADIRQLIASGLAEHLQLEYKSALYANSDAGKKESLLDICMFANAQGGVLLLGIPELRDARGEATGVPDPAGTIGIEIENPEPTLLAYDARVTASIEERLPLESTAIRLNGGSYVLAFRIANSPSKPHCVRYQGHGYFPSRRERNRYEMDVREIKELVMQTGSQLDKCRERLNQVFHDRCAIIASGLLIGVVPVFFKEFSVDLRQPNVRQAVAAFDVTNDHAQIENITYAFEGLERRVPNRSVVQLQRSGLVFYANPLWGRLEESILRFSPAQIDLQLRRFILRLRDTYAVSGMTGPFVLSMRLSSNVRVIGVYPDIIPGVYLDGGMIQSGDYSFPAMVVDDFADLDNVIHPFCDQAHQSFGRTASPCFDAEGHWIGVR